MTGRIFFVLVAIFGWLLADALLAQWAGLELNRILGSIPL